MTNLKRQSVRLIQAEDVMDKLPRMQPWETKIPREVDLFILGAGFEERVLEFPKRLAEANVRSSHILVGQYNTNLEDNELVYQKVRPDLQRITNNIEFTHADEPDDVSQNIARLLNGLPQGATVLFDISSSSGPLISSVIGSLADAKKQLRLHILYCEAGSYNEPQNLEKPPESWSGLSETGVSGVLPHALFPGSKRDGAHEKMISFPSINLSRSARCLQAVSNEFERFALRNVTWVYPCTQNADHQWRQNKIRESVAQIWKSETGKETYVECDTHSYESAIKVVLDFCLLHQGENLSSSLMGSKIQTLGASMALCVRRELANIYARPDKFIPTEYSSGIGKLWHIEFPDLDALLSHIGQCGNIDHTLHQDL